MSWAAHVRRLSAPVTTRRWAHVRRLATLSVLAPALAACATTYAPTYTSAGVTLAPCPRGHLRPGQTVSIPFTVVNRSSRTWPATYTHVTIQEAAEGYQSILGAPEQPIGGNIRRVLSPLAPGHAVHGKVVVSLRTAAVGQVNLGAWGAPSNSVAVPNSYPNPACVLRP